MGNFITSFYTIHMGSVVGALTTIIAANAIMPIRRSSSRDAIEVGILTCLSNMIFGGVGSLLGAAIATSEPHTATFPLILTSVAALIALNRR